MSIETIRTSNARPVVKISSAAVSMPDMHLEGVWKFIDDQSFYKFELKLKFGSAGASPSYEGQEGEAPAEPTIFSARKNGSISFWDTSLDFSNTF